MRRETTGNYASDQLRLCDAALVPKPLASRQMCSERNSAWNLADQVALADRLRTEALRGRGAVRPPAAASVNVPCANGKLLELDAEQQEPRSRSVALSPRSRQRASTSTLKGEVRGAQTRLVRRGYPRPGSLNLLRSQLAVVSSYFSLWRGAGVEPAKAEPTDLQFLEARDLQCFQAHECR
jgi:hypothetical protein